MVARCVGFAQHPLAGTLVTVIRYFFSKPLDRNCIVTLSPIGNCCVLSFRSITASRIARLL